MKVQWIGSANPTVRNALAAMNAALFKCVRCGSTGDPYDGFCRRFSQWVRGGYPSTDDHMMTENL